MNMSEKENYCCRKCYYAPLDGRDDIISVMFYHSRFIVCKICGNKRCPHATDHEFECTNSNEPGQTGSFYE